jgi:hypothetical protein
MQMVQLRELEFERAAAYEAQEDARPCLLGTCIHNEPHTTKAMRHPL